MSASPRTPRHSRDPSAADLSFATPLLFNNDTPRRHSKGSINTPASPQMNDFARSNSGGVDVFSSGGPAAVSNGLGNLADELADAWGDGEEEDEEYEPDMNFQEAGGEEDEPTRDSGVDVRSSPVEAQPKLASLSPPMPFLGGGRAHKRQPSEYDGSDYGGNPDLEPSSIPPALLARMDTVESLARRGAENNGTDRDGVVKRVIEGLKDLGGQSAVEGNATRFVLL